MSRSEHVFIDTSVGQVADVFVPGTRRTALADHATLHCSHCGERFPMPLGRIEFVIGVGKAFSRAHARCKKPA